MRRTRTSTERADSLRISYDAGLDFLWAVVIGEVVDDPLADETQEPIPELYVWTRGPSGQLIGFGIQDLSDWSLDQLSDLEEPLLAGRLFHVPTLGLRASAAEHVILAARAILAGHSTPDRMLFNAAVAAVTGVEEPSIELLEEAEGYWRACLAAGELRAHYGLGYTLYELGREREAYGHLRTFTELVPRGSWGWVWRGKACEAMGEIEEASTCYRRAIGCAAGGSFETNAEQLLDALEAPR